MGSAWMDNDESRQALWVPDCGPYDLKRFGCDRNSESIINRVQPHCGRYDFAGHHRFVSASDVSLRSLDRVCPGRNPICSSSPLPTIRSEHLNTSKHGRILLRRSRSDKTFFPQPIDGFFGLSHEQLRCIRRGADLPENNHPKSLAAGP